MPLSPIQVSSTYHKKWALSRAEGFTVTWCRPVRFPYTYVTFKMWIQLFSSALSKLLESKRPRRVSAWIIQGGLLGLDRCWTPTGHVPIHLLYCNATRFEAGWKPIKTRTNSGSILLNVYVRWLLGAQLGLNYGINYWWGRGSVHMPRTCKLRMIHWWLFLSS